MNRFSILLLITMGFGSTSCFWVTTKKEGQILRSDIDKIENRVSKMESELEQERAHMTEMIERARTEVEKLEDTLNQATRILARNNADFGAEMESVRTRIQEINGSIAEIQHGLESASTNMENLDKRLIDFAGAAGIDIPIDDSKVPTKPEDHFQAIKNMTANGRYGEARSLAKIYLDRYPKNTNADDVQLIVGKTYISQKRWAKALDALRLLTEKYPNSDLTPEALYEMARSFLALGDCTDARIVIEAITSKYKKNPFAEKANSLDAEIKKNKTRCNP